MAVLLMRLWIVSKCESLEKENVRQKSKICVVGGHDLT